MSRFNGAVRRRNVDNFFLVNTVVGNYNNTMKTTLELNFDLNYTVKQHGIHKNKEAKRINHLKKLLFVYM